MKGDLYVGITTSNSAAFLPACLSALRRHTEERATRVVVLDNASLDDTVELAKGFGAEVVVRRSDQAMALVDLFNDSRAEFTLLIHADVVLLSAEWRRVCTARLRERVALVSPEDIGCGPFTRPWGKGMPESSFLLFRTRAARRIRRWLWRRRFRLRLPYRGLDLTGAHVTHNLPERLRAEGLDWHPMRVHASPRVSKPIYTPGFDLPQWTPELALYRYGLGNFYSLDGVITHYHNWYERALEDVPEDSTRTLTPAEGGLPLVFLKRYTQNFLGDLERGELALPPVSA